MTKQSGSCRCEKRSDEAIPRRPCRLRAPRMRRIPAFLACLQLVLLLGLPQLPANAAETRDPATFFTLNMGDLAAELAEGRKAGKKALLVMFEQERCPGCLYMKQNVLSRGDVQDYYRRNFVTLSVDIRSAVPLRDLAGREQTEKSFAQSSKVKGTPTFVFYDLAGREITRVLGTVETAAEFLLLGEYVASGAYKTRSFAQYKLDNPDRKGS